MIMVTEMLALQAVILFRGYERLLKIGWKGVYAELLFLYNALSDKEREGTKGAQLKAMMTSSTMARGSGF